jgi:hypothetical protein
MLPPSKLSPVQRKNTWDDPYDSRLTQDLKEAIAANNATTSAPDCNYAIHFESPPTDIHVNSSVLDGSVQRTSNGSTNLLLPKCHDPNKTCVMCNTGESTI